uniref:Uncharacterized protein n=1 Tax=Siphoviridae sp. ct6d71 TaxID=2826298 RepID=A0A8S5R393_9CAUD|nr:MAG TPA: hypothetical protein [Siphoviridae sp. ct6d71]
MHHLFNFFYFRYFHAYIYAILRCSLNSFRVFQQFE